MPTGLGALACVLALGACSIREPLLSILFEVPAAGKSASPKPVVRKVRHPPPQAPAPVLADAEFPPIPEPTDWRAAFDALPRENDEVDWVRALREKFISPKPAIVAGADRPDALDLDVELVPKGMPEQAVTFSHAAHTQWLTCANCHPAIFEMQGGADPITMASILEGKYCGECHGKVAFEVATGCPRCHGKKS